MSEPVTPPVEATPAPTVGLSELTETQRHEWLKTGELPSAEPETSPIPGAALHSDEPAAGVDAKAPVEPVDAKKPKPRDDINARLGQLAEQRRAATDRAEAAERERDELKAKIAAGASPTTTAAGKPAEPVPAKPPTHLELVKKYQSEPDWPTLQQAIDAGFEDPYQASVNAQNLYINEQQFAEREQARTHAAVSQRAEANVDRTWTEGKAKYPDWDPSPLKDLSGQSAAIFAQLLFESPLSVELLYHFSKHPAEARTLAAMEPLAAAHALGKVESQLSTPAPSRIATKTTSDAPEPPMTLGARHTPGAGDDADDALKAGDFPRYREIMNKRELAGSAR